MDLAQAKHPILGVQDPKSSRARPYSPYLTLSVDGLVSSDVRILAKGPVKTEQPRIEGTQLCASLSNTYPRTPSPLPLSEISILSTYGTSSYLLGQCRNMGNDAGQSRLSNRISGRFVRAGVIPLLLSTWTPTDTVL